jgi:DNA-binding response OmpR family regulator
MNILVVEDEALVALLVQEVVEEAGHACVGPVASVGEACALIDSCQVDATLLDIWLKDNEFVYPAARKLASRASRSHSCLPELWTESIRHSRIAR